MSPEAPKTKTPVEEAEIAFHDALIDVYKFTGSDEFLDACLQAGINVETETGTPAYWNLFAVVADKHTQEERARIGDSLQLSAFELIALTPDYLFRQEGLDNKAYRDRGERQIARETVSYFNGLLRGFAGRYPETPVAVVARSLNGIAEKSLENEHLKKNAGQQLLQTLRGAQHELAFSQILWHTGRNFAPASLEEDLRGIDYVVEGFGGQQLYVDVKASLSEIESRDKVNSAFACTADGKVIMYSLTRDNEFNGMFFTSNEIAQSKATVLNAFLAQAQQDLSTETG